MTPSARPDRASPLWDVIIVGAGPAGLSAALVLGRCQRSVLVLDDGRPRNGCTAAAHGFFTRDGARPSELLAIGRKQLRPYGVRLERETVTSARRLSSGFVLRGSEGRRHRCRMLLLATGMQDQLPAIEGFDALYGKSAFHCPYCDGWEQRGKRWLAYGKDKDVVKFALGLTSWSSDVLLCSDGWNELTRVDREKLAAHGVVLETRRLRRFISSRGRLRAVELEDGERLERDVLFFHCGAHQKSRLAEKLGCKLHPSQDVEADDQGCTACHDLYVAGDASSDKNFIALAAAAGVNSATAIHQALREAESRDKLERWRRRRARAR